MINPNLFRIFSRAAQQEGNWKSINRTVLVVATGSAIAFASSPGFAASRHYGDHLPRQQYPSYHANDLSSSLCNRSVCESSLKNEPNNKINAVEESESQRFERILAHHRSLISKYRSSWEYKPPSSETGEAASTSFSTVTPSISWPDDIPSNEDLPFLMTDLKYCSRSPNFRSDKDYCHHLSFRVASALLIQFDEGNQRRGLEILKKLAETGYPDAMAYYGMCLNEGRAGLDPDATQAVKWFRRCANMYEHPQAQYELGVAYYTGEGVVENEEESVSWFQLAAEKNHPAACYMLGDCLLDGIGAEMDRGAALEWLVRSSKLGHRGARSRVMAVLEKKDNEDYGRFTDASRQTMVEHTVLAADGKERIIKRKSTALETIGGGSRNQAELSRRQTIVSKSRNNTVIYKK